MTFIDCRLSLFSKSTDIKVDRLLFDLIQPFLISLVFLYFSEILFWKQLLLLFVLEFLQKLPYARGGFYFHFDPLVLITVHEVGMLLVMLGYRGY